MGILDSLVKNPQMIADVAKFAKDNPQVAKAAMDFLSSQSGGGLSSVLGALQANGMGDAVSSWISTGKNKSITAQEIQSALGRSKVHQFATQAGVDDDQASATLAGLLPGLVDKLSPDGKMPDSQNLERLLGSIIGRA